MAYQGWSLTAIADRFREGVPRFGDIAVPSPLLELPLVNNLAMVRGVGAVNFSRATTATYIDRYGVLQIAAIDEPRFEKDGLLIEGASTNYALYSNDLSGADYSHNHTIQAPTTSIDGNNTALIVSLDPSVTGNAQAFGAVVGSMSVSVGDVVTCSIIAKKVNHHIRMDMNVNIIDSYSSATFDLDSGIAYDKSNEVTPSIENLGNGFFKCSITATATKDSSTVNVVSYAISNPMSVSSIVQADGSSSTPLFIVEKFQAEKLPFATSYIPTDASAVTRSADKCYVDYDGNHPYVASGEELSYSIDYSLLNTNAFTLDRYLLSAGLGAPSRYSMVRFNKGTTVVSFYRDGSITSCGHFSTELTRLIITVGKDDEVNTYNDGSKIVTRVSPPLDYSQNPSKIGIGNTGNGTGQIYGHIKNFKIWDKELTANQVKVI